jgi:ADP-dependent NAD(P)H-hydrate dehydratase / NAD(P)H-hydrate epimerase
MERDYWLRQTAEQPLFPELEWSRPENRAAAGKLLIIGGNLHGFAAPAEAYAAAMKAGAGTARVLLPNAVQKIVGPILENGEFAPSTPASGSFSQKALGELVTHARWADSVLLAGDLGRNSETAIVLEKFLAKCPLPLTLTKDAVDYVTSAPHIVLNRPHTLLVLSLSQLQRLGTAAKFTKPVTLSMDLLHIVEWLHSFTVTHRPAIIVKHFGQLLVATEGKVSSTALTKEKPIWRVQMATNAAVWWLQNPNKPFEALTTAVATLYSKP